MSKKHFIALANVIREHNRVLADADDKFSPSQIIVLAEFCRDQNSRFDRQRWLDYIAGTCGPNGGTVKKQAKSSLADVPNRRADNYQNR